MSERDPIQAFRNYAARKQRERAEIKRTPEHLAELRNKLVALSAQWRSIVERYDARDERAVNDARVAAAVRARETILEFGKLARAIVEAFGRDCFPASIPDPPRFVFDGMKMQEHAFGVKGVKLETIVVGGRRFTSAEALERFIARTTAAANGEPAPIRTCRQRQRAIAAAEAALAADGI